MLEGVVTLGSTSTSTTGWEVIRRPGYRRSGGVGVEIDFSKRKEVKIKPGSRQERAVKKKEAESRAKETELKNRYTTFLTNHVNTLIGVLGDYTQQEVTQFLSTPQHKHDRDMLSFLTNVVEHKDGTTKRVIDTAKIDAFLNKPEGVKILTQIMAQDIAIKQLTLPLLLQTVPPGERALMVENIISRLGVDRRIGNKLIWDHIIPFLNVPYDRTGFRTDPNSPLRGLKRYHVLAAIQAAGLGAGVGAMLFGGGLPVALAAGGAVNLAYLVGSRFVPGLEIQSSKSPVGLQSLVNDPIEREYVRKMFNVHVEDYEIVAGQVRAKRSADIYYPHRTGDVEELAKEVLGEVFTRQMYYESIGIDSRKIDALEEQFLYDRSYIQNRRGTQLGTPEQIETDYLKKTSRIFHETEYPAGRVRCRGVRDGNGNFIEYFNGGTNTWDRNPHFHPELHGWDTVGNLARFREARLLVLGRDMEEFIHSYLDTDEFKRDAFKGGKSTEVLSMIDGKKTARESGKLVQDRQKPFEERVAILTEEDNLLTERKTAIDNYNNQVKTSDDALASADKKYGTGVGAPQISNMGQIDTLIGERNKFIDDPAYTRGAIIAPPGTFSIQRRRASIEGIMADQVTAQMLALPPIVDPALRASKENEIEARVKSNHKYELQQLQKEEDTERRQITELESLKTQIENAQNVLQSSNEVSKKASAITEAWTRSYNAVHEIDGTPIPGGGAVSLTNIELLTLPYNEIMSRANQAYALDIAAGLVNPRGWPPEHNTRSEIRQQVFNAITEVRARNIDPTIVGRATRAAFHFNDLITCGVSETQMVSNSRDESMRLINQACAADVAAAVTNPRGWPEAENADPARIATVNEAVAEARRRLNVRLRAIDERKPVIDETIRTENEAKERVKNDFEADKNRLVFINDLLTNQAEIYSRMKLRFNEDLVRSDTFFEPIDPADPDQTIGLKPYELAMMYTPAGGGPLQHVPKGYLELMDIFFDYKRKPNGEQILREKSALPYFTPEYLASVLDKMIFNGGHAIAGTLDIRNVLFSIRTNTLNGRNSRYEMIEASRTIVDSWANDAIKM